MEEQINELKKSFSSLIDVRADVLNTMNGLTNIIVKLKNIYADFIKKNQDKILVFGLDSLRFQTKIIDIEYEDMKRLFYIINNRMYCEYYKLYKIIVEYIAENVSDEKIIEMVKSDIYVFPVYKDLEPFKQYEIEVLQNINEAIFRFLSAICSYIMNKEQDLKRHQVLNKTGLNIDNFVMSFNYNIIVMKDKVSLFISNMTYFHSLHLKLLTKLSTKISLMMKHVKSDIKLENLSRPKKKKIMDNTFENENGEDANGVSSEETILNAIKSADMSDNEDAYSTDIDSQDMLETPMVIVDTTKFVEPSGSGQAA